VKSQGAWLHEIGICLTSDPNRSSAPSSTDPLLPLPLAYSSADKLDRSSDMSGQLPERGSQGELMHDAVTLCFNEWHHWWHDCRRNTQTFERTRACKRTYAHIHTHIQTDTVAYTRGMDMAACPV